MLERSPTMPDGRHTQPPPQGAWQPPSVLTTLWSEKTTFVAAFLFLIGLCVVFCGLIVPQYRAETLVLVEPRQARLVEQSTVLDAQHVDLEFLQTEAQIIQSPHTLEAVAAALRLQDDPEFRGSTQASPDALAQLHTLVGEAVDQVTGYRRPAAPASDPGTAQEIPVTSAAALSLARRVTAAPVGKTYLIAVTASSSDPVKAARIANSLASHYISDRISSRVEASEAASAAIQSRLNELEERLHRAQVVLAEFKARTGLMQTLSAAGTPTSIRQQELSDVSAQLEDARSQELRLASKLQQMTNTSARNANEVMASPLIQQLRTREAVVSGESAQLAARYGPNHPRTHEIDEQLAAIRGEIARAVEDIRRSVAGELAGVHDREQSLKARLAALRGRMSAEGGAEAQLATLQEDVASSKAVYETFLARFKATTEQRHLEQPVAAVVSSARVPRSPVSPRNLFLLLGTIGVSVFGAAGAAFARARLRRGFQAPSQLAAELGVPEVVALPAVREAAPGMGNAGCDPTRAVRSATPFAEALSNLSFGLASSADGSAVLLTSSVPNEGKTFLSLALATQIASRGKRTLLIDCDLYKGGQDGDDPPPRGLGDCLLGEVGWQDAIRRPGRGNPDVLCSGVALQDPTGALSSPILAMIVARMRSCYDVIILDGPPVLLSPGVRSLATVADWTVVVVRSDSTARADVRAAAHQLALSGVRIGAVALNFVRPRHIRHDRFYRYYGTSARSGGVAAHARVPAAEPAHAAAPDR